MTVIVFSSTGVGSLTGLTDIDLNAEGIGSTANALTIDMSGVVQKNETLTLTENITTLTLQNFAEGSTLFLVTKNESGSDLSVTFPSGHFIDGGIASSPLTISNGSRWLLSVSFLDSGYHWTASEMTLITPAVSANLKFLVNFETSLNDESPAAYTAVPAGAAPWALSATNPKFGVNAAEHLSDTDGTLSYGVASDWRFLNDGSAYTIAGWAYFASFAGTTTILQTSGIGSGDGPGIQLFRNLGSRFAIGVRDASITGSFGNSAQLLSTATYHFLSVVYDPVAGEHYVGVDGTVQSSVTLDTRHSANDPENPLTLGGGKDNPVNGNLDSWIIEDRAVIEYTSNFTPPTNPFTTSGVP